MLGTQHSRFRLIQFFHSILFLFSLSSILLTVSVSLWKKFLFLPNSYPSSCCLCGGNLFRLCPRADLQVQETFDKDLQAWILLVMLD